MLEEAFAHFYRDFIKMKASMADFAWLVVYPFIGLLSIGLLAAYFMASGSSLEPLAYIFVGILAWNFYKLAQKSITYGLIFDVWDQCLKHTMTAKAKVEDFIIGNGLFGLFSGVFVTVLIGGMAIFLFKFNIFSAGIFLVIGLIALFLYAIAEGLLINSLVILKGYDYIALIWIITGIVMVFSGVYYPLDFIPMPLRYISFALPTTYAIAAIREAIFGAYTIAIEQAGYAVLSSLIYFLISLITFKKAIKRSKKTGSITWF